LLPNGVANVRVHLTCIMRFPWHRSMFKRYWPFSRIDIRF
jgi:hypothetical protein